MAMLLAAALALAECAAAQDLDVHVAVPSAAGTLPSVVYAVPQSARALPRAGGTVVIDQINKQFSPQVSVIETGTAVSFPNKDNIRHHVYSFSPAKPFELKLYSGKPSSPVVFENPGVVTLGCNIHDVMIAYVLVVETPYHAVADPQGVARIHSLPAGDYIIHAWTPGIHQGEHPTQSVHVAAAADPVSRIDVPAVNEGTH